jgi:hypothetical protein
MSKEKIQSLTKYVNDLKAKQSSPLSEKQKNRPAQYKQFLEREIASTQAKIDAMKMSGAPEAKK